MTYEYICAACNHQWEAEQSITESPLKTCPHCHEQSAKRQVSGGAGFILKGGGWYADGYGTPSKKQDGASETTKSSEGEKTPSADKKTSEGSSGEPKKTESKPAEGKVSDAPASA